MTTGRGALLAALRSTRQLADRAEADPLGHMRWLPPQQALLSAREKRVALRGPNQALGKTTAGAAELVYRLLGAHPYKPVRPAPVKAWVVCGSLRQARVVQERVWSLVPKDMVEPRCYYDPRKGEFHGRFPALRLKNGSVAEFFSGGGAGVSLASGTVDVVWIDEPPASSRVYTEVQKRLLRTNGSLYMTFTPVNAPVEWIREECERGTIRDLHFPLRAEYLIPVGASEPIRLMDGTLCDQGWIDRITEETLPYERPVVIGGEWEFRLDGAIFAKSWKPEVHVTDRLPSGMLQTSLGIDYGDRENKQTATLVAVDERGTYPAIWVLDEVHADGTTTIDQDAKQILAMLAGQRPPVPWSRLDHAHGDRIHRGGVETKSNKDLMRALAREMRLPSHEYLKPGIRTVKRGKGQNQWSVQRGERFLHQAMLRADHFHVHPRCKKLIESLSKYNGADDGSRDSVDSLRYALWPWAFPTPASFRGTVRLV